MIENHVRYAGAQGFLTNLGGLVTDAVTIPANITGLALIQCRMVAGIAHLRGYDLDDPRVRNAILTCLLGEDSVNTLIKKKKLPAPPMALATAPAHDPDLDRIISAEVASELITRVAGKRLADRRPPDPRRRRLRRDGRGRLRHLADRTLRRPRAPAPRPPVDAEQPPPEPAALEAHHQPAAHAVRRRRVRTFERPTHVRELGVHHCLLR